MDREPNTVCKICGKKYYHCNDCEKIPGGNWRMVACSPECWNEWCDRIDRRRAAERAAEVQTEEIKNTEETESTEQPEETAAPTAEPVLPTRAKKKHTAAAAKEVQAED